MYCAKCGKELIDNEQFCPNCGTKSGSAGKTINLNLSTDGIKNKTKDFKTNFVSGVADLGKNKIPLFVDITFIILSMIFSVTPTIKISSLFGISQSMAMFDGGNAVKVIFILCCIISILFLIIPLIIKKSLKSLFFLPTKIIMILVTLYFLSIICIGIYETNSSAYSSIADFGLSVTGWLFLVVTLGAIVLSFKISHDLKKKTSAIDSSM